MAAAMLPLLLLWGCAEAANEQETNIGDFLFDDQKVTFLVSLLIRYFRYPNVFSPLK